jgi:hypothetical protein
MVVVSVVVSVLGSGLHIHLVSEVRVPLLLVLLKLNAVGFIDLHYGQGGQAIGDFLEHYIININISRTYNYIIMAISI